MGKRTEASGRVKVRAAGWIGLALAGLLSACSGESAINSGPPTEGATLREWLDHFESTGAMADVSAEQRAVLDNAADRGELTFEDLTGLIQLTFACVEEQGLSPMWLDPLTDSGYPVPFYAITESAQLGSTASQAIIDDCTNRYSGLAEQLFRWQPTNLAIAEAKWERDYRVPLLTCLREHGVEIDDAATRQEIEVAAAVLSQATGPMDDPVFGPNCFVEVGLS
jgi:hypothetical protein